MVIIRDNVIISKSTNIGTVERGQIRQIVVGKHEIVLLKAEKKKQHQYCLSFWNNSVSWLIQLYPGTLQSNIRIIWESLGFKRDSKEFIFMSLSGQK